SPDNHPAAAIFRLQRLYPGLFPAASVYTDGRRDEWLFVSAGKHQLLACGMPIEYPFDYTTHGHGDLGSFVWAYDHRPLLVDAGRASYITDKQAELQCGPCGHNSLMVQGLAPLADTLLSNGRWCPRPYAEAVVSLEHKSGSGFFLEHDSFARICGVGKHSRSVQINDGNIAVVDTLKGVGLVEIDMYWHFAPHLSALEETPYAASGSGFRVLIEESGTNSGTAGIEWDEYPYSAAYGEVQNAFVLHTKRKVSLPWSVTTTLKVVRCAE
ncbi:MAG: heparinase II/III family protein, partial [Proteobacteria bacterium]|nr:heparinase II/III family protein [Pseudomonadota bacterium]